MEWLEFLLYKGSGFVDKVISWQTRGPYTHLAIRYKDTIWEAKFGKGVIKRKTLDDDRVDTFGVELNEWQVQAVVEFLDAQVGKKYDTLMVLRFISRRGASSSTQDKWFCSELGFMAAKIAGINLLARTEAWEVHPNLFSRSPFFQAPY